MKCLQRCCCLLCALVLLSTVFSINAHAKDSDIPEYYINHGLEYTNLDTGATGRISQNFNPNNNNQDILTKEKYWALDPYLYEFIMSYEYVTNDPPLISSGGNSVVTMFEGYYGFGLSNDYGGFWYFRNITRTRLLITYSDNTQEYIDDLEYTLNDSKLTLKCEFTPNKDVKSLKFLVYQTIDMSAKSYISVYLGERSGVDSGYVLSVNQQSEESGLLSGILGWVKNIFNKIGDTFDSVVQGFADVGSWLAELPSKLWNLISDGLKNLFVPSEDFIIDFKEDMDTMLSDKLGAVYQVIDITLESWDRISASDKQNSINLPQTTISLPEGNSFSFGGYDVQIVPSGFDMLADAIKLIGGILCTILFVNGLRKRYDEVMGVEK